MDYQTFVVWQQESGLIRSLVITSSKSVPLKFSTHLHSHLFCSDPRISHTLFIHYKRAGVHEREELLLNISKLESTVVHIFSSIKYSPYYWQQQLKNLQYDLKNKIITKILGFCPWQMIERTKFAKLKLLQFLFWLLYDELGHS